MTNVAVTMESTYDLRALMIQEDQSLGSATMSKVEVLLFTSRLSREKPLRCPREYATSFSRHAPAAVMAYVEEAYEESRRKS